MSEDKEFLLLSFGGTQDCPEFVGLGSSCICSKCYPGLECSTSKICTQVTCNSNEWTNLPWRPSCEADGTFSAKQCKGDEATGRCFCYSPKGERIFGWSWWKDAENMTCACSRRRAELRATRPDLSLHCTENGNYDELQCDNGLCWCTNPRTGQPLERIFPESMMKYLTCYKEHNVGTQYLRQCESKRIAGQKILEQLTARGRLYSFIPDALCDGDGSYGPLRVDRKTVFCTWKDSSRLENYQNPIGNVRAMNCNCARDTKIFTDENMENLLSCETNGNYEALQFSNGRPFCVDSDGYAISGLGDWGDAACPL
ncbi:uncharacterized protein LOC135166769 [Diachasmimorpha longicaudata]|uniref:uncharacterized protein LOC135166769 n=1 Tax=Diachasmimorpha longicaudata TaxID=58733 RepID=UPI0030B8A3FD